jgi:hypothetical protein
MRITVDKISFTNLWINRHIVCCIDLLYNKKEYNLMMADIKVMVWQLCKPPTANMCVCVCVYIYISCVWLYFRHTCDLITQHNGDVWPQSRVTYWRLYFYSKTNQMHNISNLFYFGTTLYCLFWTVSPFIIRSLRLYIQHQVYVES